jgi:tetratricopeptide (TPR) repeat protein
MDEALAEIRRAKALDPLSPIINTRVGTVLVYAHKYDEAAGELRKALDLDPTNILARFELGRALSLSGRMNEALQQFTDALDLETGHDKDDAAVAYGQDGEHARARNILTRLQARSKDRYISPRSLSASRQSARATNRSRSITSTRPSTSIPSFWFSCPATLRSTPFAMSRGSSA